MSSFELKELKDLSIEIIDGDRGLHYPPKTEFASGGFCLFLNTGNVTTSGFNFSTLDFIDEKRDSLLKKGKLKLYDIVLTTRGTVGNVGFFDETIPYENIRINSGMVILRTDRNEIAPYYLYSFLKSDLFKKQVKSQGSGSAQPQLPISSLKNISLPLFELKTQQRIASVLSALDSKIDLNNRINAELEAMAKTLYDYWFVQFDFPEQHGKPYKANGGKMVWNDELKREIPEGWEVKNLIDVASVLIRGVSPKYIETDGICVLNQKCIRNKSINFSFGRRHDDLSKNVESRLIKIGDILVNSTGTGTLGRVAIVKWLEETLTTTDSHVTIVRIDDNKANPYFTGYSLTEKQSEIEQLGEGSTGQTELSRDNLGRLKLIVPPDCLQKTFEKFIKPQFQKIALNEKENQQLAELRDWLLPLLMNGQVTVEDTCLEE